MKSILSKLQRSRTAGVQSSSFRSTILVPLYIYPLNATSWKPLHTAIAEHPDLEFVIIVNPHNGPGEDALPDENYSVEIPKLNAHPNVQTVGYVRTDYCRRALTSVCEDIAKFAGWSAKIATPADTNSDDDDDKVTRDPGSKRNTADLDVRGIFFDETPNLYTPAVAVYLNSITKYVKGMHGILGSRLVIHNPGTVPDTGLASPGPDVTAIVEGTYELYRMASTQERISSLLRYERNRCCYIVHSVPKDEVKALVLELRRKAKYIFVTELSEGVYTQFGPRWKKFIEAMAMD